MAEFGLNRNGSGYYDETAYKAFMGMAKPGDIWTNYCASCGARKDVG